MTDAQIWSAASLMQGLRELLPFGQIWTAIIPYLVQGITAIESKTIHEVSFYEDTRKQLEEMGRTKIPGTDRNRFKHILITGHSLGGGLAMINGAQTGYPAIGISGVNARLTSRSLPDVNTRNLDKLTFNVIPDRDLVPRLDDVSRNSQKIRCLANEADVAGCHMVSRTLCELLYICGSKGRPIPCECITDFCYTGVLDEDDKKVDFKQLAEKCSVDSISCPTE